MPTTKSKSSNQLFEFFMLPCSSLMSKLSLRTKLFCMFGTFIAVILLLGTYTIEKQFKEVNIARNEQQGVLISGQIMNVMVQTQKHRGQINLQFSGQNMDAALAKTRSDLSTSIHHLEVSIAKNPEFQLAAGWQATSDELRKLSEGKIAASAIDSFSRHSELVLQILRFSALNNEKSGLLFDPEAPSYLLMDIAMQKIPVWLEHIAVMRGIGAGHIKVGSINISEKTALFSRLDAAMAAMAAVTETDAALERAGEQISTEQKNAMKASEDFAANVRNSLLGDAINGDASAYFASGTNAVEKNISFQLRQQNRLTDILNDRIEALDRQRHIIIFAMAGMLLATIYLVLGFYRSFMLAMGDVGKSARSVAAGDLTSQIHIDGKDELAQTGVALEEMNLNLSALVANVRTNAHMVSQLGQQLALGMSDMSIRTEQQASSLEQTSASVEDLAATVKKNAENARIADNLASNVRLIAESSGAVMHAAVDSMQGIQQSSVKMNEIVSMIDQIAFQTEILALNAAVEASHAGTHGLGFAVVATEVRGLAQRTADAARQIRRLIDDSVSKVKNGVEQINEVNVTLSDIVNGIRNLAGNTNLISNASAEQSNGLAQISEAIHHLDEITQSNAKMAEDTKNTSIDLEARALLLTQAVSTFKLRQGTADEAYAMVKQALAIYRTEGNATLRKITEDKEKVFADRDMYVFAFDHHGQYRAFAGNASKLEINLLNLSGLDGRKLVTDAFSISSSGGWVDYTILNPVTKIIETKTSYIERLSGDLVLGCGVYKSA